LENARREAAKKPPLTDSLVPPAGDFGYAVVRHLIRNPEETMP
jgi:hypothetical protein